MESLSGFIAAFMSASIAAGENFQPFALALFAGLGLIGLAKDVTYAIVGNSQSDVLNILFKRCVLMGCLILAITQWPGFMGWLMLTAVELGSSVVGGDPDTILQPMTIIPAGWTTVNTMSARAYDIIGLTPRTWLIAATLQVSALLTILGYIVLAAVVAAFLVEFWVVGATAVMMVATGILDTTRFLAQGALGTMAAQAVRLLFVAVLLGIGRLAIGEMPVMDPTNTSPTMIEAFEPFGVVLLWLVLTFSASKLASSLTSGVPQLGGSSVLGATFVAGTLGAAGAALGAGAVGAGMVAAKGGGAAAARSAMASGASRAGGIMRGGMTAGRHLPD